MGMRKKTDRALNGAIVHWEQNLAAAVAGEPIKIGAAVCPLCNLFLLRDCYGCPVARHTNKTNCEKSPYNEVIEAVRSGADKEVLTGEVQRELNFLRSVQEKRKAERKRCQKK